MTARNRLFQAILLVATGLMLTMNSSGASRQDWINKFNGISLDAHLVTGDSGTLAWNEAYIMMALLNMYEATGNIQYLGRFVDHADEIMGTQRSAVMQSPYGTGKGWTTALYSTNTLAYADGECADFDDARANNTGTCPSSDVPFTECFASGDFTTNNWVNYGNKAYIDSGAPVTSNPALNDDSYSCRVETDGIGWRHLSTTIPTTFSAGLYCITFQGKIEDTSPIPTGFTGRLLVKDSLGTIVGDFCFKDTAWTKYGFLINLSSASTIKLYLYASGYAQAGFKSYFDNIRCVKVNNGVIPGGWTIVNTDRNNAYMETGTENLSGSLGCFAISGASDRFFNSSVLWNSYRENGYEPGMEYEVRFKAKASSALGGWKVQSRDNGSSMTQVGTFQGNNTSWGTYSFRFTAPSTSGHNLQIRLYPYNSVGTAYFDNITVSEVVPYAAHDGMILAPVAKFIMLVNRGQVPAAISPDTGGTPATAYSYYNLADKANTYRDIIITAGTGDNINLLNKWAFCLSSDYLAAIPDAGNLAAAVYTVPLDGSFDLPTSTASPDLAPYSLPHNQYLALGMVYSYLARSVFGDSSTPGYTSSASSYAAVSEKMAVAFRSKLVLHNDAEPYTYSWNYNDRMLTTGNIDCIEYAGYSVRDEDTGHGSLDVAGAAGIYAAGIASECFSVETMQYLANTFYYTMCGGSSGNDYPGDTVTSSAGTSCRYATWGWIKLALFLPGIYDKTYSFFDSNFSTLGYSHACVISEIIKGKPLIYETFENPDASDPLKPADWIRNGSSTYVFLDEQHKVDGDTGLTVDGTNSCYLKSQPITLKANYTYVLTFMGKKESGLANGAAVIKDASGVTVTSITFYNSDWQQKTLTYTNSTGSDITGATLRFSASNSNGACVHFDNVELREQFP